MYLLDGHADIKRNYYCGIGIILGDVVMKGFSVTFDRVHSMLGFAVSKCAGKIKRIELT